MRLSFRCLPKMPVIALFAIFAIFGARVSVAQKSGFNLELHANKNVSAAEVGLPAYPGATLVKDTDDDSTADLGFTFGNTHFRIMVAKYSPSESADQVLGFYRKPLSRFGEVLECNHGQPIGALTVTHSGLT